MHDLSTKLVAVALAVTSLVMPGCKGGAEPIRAAPPPSGVYQPLISRVGNLIRFPEGSSATERYYFIRDLGETRDPVAYPILAAVLRGEQFNAHEKAVAARALAKLGDERALGLIRDSIQSDSIGEAEGVVALGILAFTANSEAALEDVIQATRPGRDKAVRVAAINAMRPVNPGHRASAHALEALMRSDASMLIRAHAACALAARGHQASWRLIEHAASHPDAQVRLAVAGYTPFERRAIGPLLELLGDQDPEVAMLAWERLDKRLDCPQGRSPTSDPSYDLAEQQALYAKAFEDWIRNER